ncbi:NADH-quinone oxidoreductase subunit M [Gloeobacter violaceus]|uniref:NADH dehydrogenase subunit 4 n=1 Tax=Gloeobacter violaceus (strain ATCC 29082 / PCC 7421) TaxID=251221 RepID=Q7NLW5_GLOVI|nr:NADH-quinone oxidoreductase subunit M [Gloeobacter violaceus]BAC88945.1 NADH dehydrogenase subunit 4 [Gloeobacter violaceus PCC 7421]
MLSVLIWLPVVGALLVGLWPGASAARLRSIALAFATAGVLWSAGLLWQFDPARPGLQFVEFIPWIAPVGLHYSLGADGLSLPLIALNSLLIWIAIYSNAYSGERPRLYYGLLLLAGGGMAGAFAAQNLLLFFLFYELELLPFYLLIFLWGCSEKRGYAAMKFLIYTAVSGFLILGAFLGLVLLDGSSSFAYGEQSTAALPLITQLILLTMLLVGFGIKIPLVPLHTWLPDAYCEASPPVAILLGGVLAKLGAYGLLRFGLGLFPETWALVAPGLATIGAITAVYGAFSAIAQRDIKRMVAYSSIGHMGYILLAAAAATPLSLLGAMLQMVSHGLILAILFHLVGVVEAKVGTRDLDVLNGLMNPIRGLPMVSALLVLGGMASAGIPGLVGFVAEFLVLQGSFAAFPVQTILCVVCSGLTAVYFVILLNRTCFGRLDNATAYYPPVRWIERTPALILAGIILVLGVQPEWLSRWSEVTAESMVTPVQSAANQPKMPAAAASLSPN